MKVLVTGGAGFIGSHLAEELVRQGHQVRILDNFSTGEKEYIKNFKKKLTVIDGDISDAKTVDSAVKGARIVFHQAAIVSIQRSLERPQETYQSNVVGTLNLFRTAVKHRVKRIVYASSCAVYGDTPLLPKKETMPVRPISFYAESKRINEADAVLFHRYFKLDTVGLRYFNVFGPRQNPDSPYSGVVSIFLKRFQQGRPPVVFGDGKQTRDFVYVKDVVRANLLASRCPSRWAGHLFNVGTGRAVSLNQLVVMLNDIFDRKMRPCYESPRLGDIRHSVADVKKAKRAFSFCSSHPFFDTLRSMALCTF